MFLFVNLKDSTCFARNHLLDVVLAVDDVDDDVVVVVDVLNVVAQVMIFLMSKK